MKFKHIENNTTILYINRKGKEYEVLIDTEDFNAVNKFKWNLQTYHKNENLLKVKTVVKIQEKKRHIYLHRFLFDEIPNDLQVDHINCNPLDNRKNNLRLVTHSENQQNRKGFFSHNKTSNIRNVHWRKERNKYRVTLQINGKRKYFGHFSDIKEAEKAAIEARRKYMPYSNN